MKLTSDELMQILQAELATVSERHSYFCTKIANKDYDSEEYRKALETQAHEHGIRLGTLNRLMEHIVLAEGDKS